MKASRDFALLLGATAISRAGTQVSMVALPLVAVVFLHASTFQAGLLATAETLAFLLIGLPAGVWADRLPLKPILVVADLVRGAVILTVPIAAGLGVLALPHLYAVAFAVGLATVFFDVAHMSFVPLLVPGDRLMEGNSRLEAVDYGAFTVGPGLGGLLVQLVTAPIALVADAASYFASALATGAIRARERAAAPTGQRAGMWPEIRSGVGFVLRHPVLRAVVTSGSLLVLFDTAWMSIQPVFLVRELGLPPVVYGLLLAAGSIGGLAGALCAARVVRRFGTTRVLRLSFVLTSPFLMVMPFAQHDWRIVLYGVGAFCSWFGSAVFNVTQVTIRQVVTPPALRGRMNATMRFVMWGAMPTGGLVGGALGQALGVRPALWVFAAGTQLAALPHQTMPPPKDPPA
jgi:MFS family permease